jgi:hypothetical protein
MTAVPDAVPIAWVESDPRCLNSLTAGASDHRDVLEGLPVVLRYIARAGGRSFLYGTDALTACQVP